MINNSVVIINQDIKLNEDDFEEVFKLISWQKVPTFYILGRTAWYQLKTPIMCGDVKCHAVKMKGIGFQDPNCNPPVIPSNKIHINETPHFGIDYDGRVVMKYSDPAPWGGICLKRAITENEVATKLFNNKISSIVPFAVIKYDDLLFEQAQMGAVLSLSPSNMPYRFLDLWKENNFIPDVLLEYYQNAAASLAIEGDIKDTETKLELGCILAEKFSACVRGFSDSGFYIHSGSWGNMQYDCESRKVFLTDLDSSRKLNETPIKVQALYMLRDLVSNLFQCVSNIYSIYSLGLHDSDSLLKHDVVSKIIKGYMPELDEKKIYQISRRIWSYFLPYFIINKKGPASYGHLPPTIRDSLRIERDFFYILCLNLMYKDFLDIYPKAIKKGALSANEFYRNCEDYLQDRCRLLEIFL